MAFAPMRPRDASGSRRGSPGSATVRRTVVLNRPPILPPRWASNSAAVTRAGTAVAAARAGRRRARRAAAAMLAIGVVVAGARVVLAPDAFGAQRIATGARVAAPAFVPAGFLDALVSRAVEGTSTSGVPARSLPDPCADVVHSAIRSLIACEATLWNVPGGAARALAVARCESRFETAAFNPSGCDGAGCLGVFQQSLQYWRMRAAEYGYPGRPATDPRANVVVSMRMAADRGTWALDWPVCGR